MVGVIPRPYDAEGRDTLPAMPNTITAKYLFIFFKF